MSIDFSKLTYWQLVWMQFRKKKLAMYSLYIVSVFLFLAIYCPLFIGNQPYSIHIGGYLLTLGDSCQTSLDAGRIPEELQQQLAQRHRLLSSHLKVQIRQPGEHWLIQDSRLVHYSVQNEWNGLNVYLGDERTVYPFFTSLFNKNYYECTVDLFFNWLMVLSPFFVLFYALNRRYTQYSFFRLFLVCLALYSVGLCFILLEPYKRPYPNWKAEIRKLQAANIPVSAVFPPIPYSYREVDTGGMDSQERHPLAPRRAHLFGTDPMGRDVFSRMTFGLRIAFSVGLVAVSIYITIGVILGALAGYFKGWVDLLISRLIEIMLCFPLLFFILTIAAMIEQRSIYHIMAIIGITSWPSVARLTRAEFLKQRELDYVQAAISQGIQRYRIVFSHILPNSIAPVLVSATFGIASSILYESTLSFLNVGDRNVASWGEILNMGRNYLKSWWLIMIPGCTIFSVVALFNLIGDGLRDSLDPKLRE